MTSRAEPAATVSRSRDRGVNRGTGLTSSAVIRVGVGGAVVELTTDDRCWAEALEERYGGFCAAGEVRFSVVCQDAGSAAGEEQGSVDVDLEHRRALVTGPPSPLQVDGLLRLVLPYLRPGSASVHAALLAEEERGWLCCGPSGAGKTTLARLFPERALCDEQALLVREDGELVVHSLPFWEARPGRVRLAGVYLLEHGSENLRRRLPAAEGLRRLAQHVRWPKDDPEAMRATFELLSSVAGEVPISVLELSPTTTVWSLIAAEEAS